MLDHELASITYNRLELLQLPMRDATAGCTSDARFEQDDISLPFDLGLSR